MIILGDIASPNAASSAELKNVFLQHAATFNNQAVVCNFEGLICDDIVSNTTTPVLYNHSSVMDVFKYANVKAVGLANNHTLDLPEYFGNTINSFSEQKIAYTGAGNSTKNAAKPAIFFDGDTEIVLFNFCWDFLLYHQKNPTSNVFVAEINMPQLLQDIGILKGAKPAAKIIVYLHWSFDLEILPFPMFRQMAKAMIDAGANAVIGTHSHCVQGGEKYKDGYIVYSLGNFFLPHNAFANGKLTFPDFSRLQMAWEWDPVSNQSVCHWFQYKNDDGRNWLEMLESSPFESSPLLKKHSPYAKADDKTYLAYFRLNRRKKFLVPVYQNYHDVYKNSFYTGLLKSRGRLARFLAKHNFRKWQS